MKTRHIVSACLAAAFTCAAVPSMSAVIIAREAPPPMRVEAVPAARAGYVWAPGHWDWRGQRYVWASGTWMRERPGYVYAAPAWVQHDGRWEYREAAWSRHDADHDGIPNRDDRHPDNPYRR